MRQEGGDDVIEEATRQVAFRPDYAIPPGETLRDTIDALGMTQADLARRTALSAKHINQIVQGIAPITPETAIAFEHVTGVPARLWNALEANYRQRLAQKRERELMESDEAWVASMPVRELVKRGALPRTTELGERFQALLSFFGVASLDAWRAVWLAPDAAFRRSRALAAKPEATAAWLRLGEIEAARVESRPYDRTRFRGALDEVRTMLGDPPGRYVAMAQELFAAAGVVLVIVPEVAGCRANGAARWLRPYRALIQLSLRYRWEDIFQFSLFHEAGHILLHGKREAFVDDGQGADDKEREADRFAAGLLIPERDAPALAEVRSLAQAETLSARLGVPPGVVVGRLQHEGRLGHQAGNALRRRLVLA
jgi:HTH-type transcriptional regulator/antitoxin HigA